MGGGSDSPSSADSPSSDERDESWENVLSVNEEEQDEDTIVPHDNAEEEEEEEEEADPSDVTPASPEVPPPPQDATWQTLRGAAPAVVVAVLLHFLLVVILGGLLVLQDRRHGAEISLLKARVATLSKKQEFPGIKRRLAKLEEHVGAIREHLVAESLIADREEALTDFSSEFRPSEAAGAATGIDKASVLQQAPGDVWAAVSALQVAASRALKAVVAHDQESSPEDSAGISDPMRDVGDAAWQLVAEAKARAAAAVNWLQSDSSDAGNDRSRNDFGRNGPSNDQPVARLRARVRALEEALQEQTTSSRQRLEAMNRRLQRLQKRHAETARRLLKAAAAAGVDVAGGALARSGGGGSTALRLSPQPEGLAAALWEAQYAYESERGFGGGGGKNGGGSSNGTKKKGKKDGKPGGGGGSGGGRGDGNHHKKKLGKNGKKGKEDREDGSGKGASKGKKDVSGGPGKEGNSTGQGKKTGRGVASSGNGVALALGKFGGSTAGDVSVGGGSGNNGGKRGLAPSAAAGADQCRD